MICPHFGVCGGCSRQDDPYDVQLADKAAMVRDALAGLSVEKWHPILPSPDTFFYRNKMEYSFGDRRDVEILNRPKGERGPAPVVTEDDNAVHLGLHPRGRFAIVTPTPECLLMSKETQTVLAVVSQWANDRKVPIYLRKNGEGDLRHLVIREGKNTGQRLVNLVARAKTPHVKDLAERLRGSGVPITTFLFSAYDGLSDVAGADKRTTVWGEGAIQEKLGRLNFTVTPGSFMQTNTRAAERMIEMLRIWSTEDSATLPRKVLIDLYCGSGAIGLNLASYYDEMIGVEIHPEAVREAWKTAGDNGIHNTRFIEGKAEDVSADLPVKERASGTTVVVDPPRAGLHTKLVRTLLDWGAPRIYYVSCNPESLGRDLRLLVERYSIVDVQPMDFFPHTDHVETMVRLKIR
jgi:23S rRNA (uracil1939-C5)-methyltransferase